MNNVIFLLKMKLYGTSPEVKFFIVCLCYLSETKTKIIETESIKKLAEKLSVSVKSAQQGIRFLEVNEFISKDKNRPSKDKPSNTRYEFTENFYSYIKLNGADEPIKSIGIRIDILLHSKELEKLSKRVAVKLFLLTLLVHADKFGVARGLSIKDLSDLITGFSKDRHRSQLAVLRKAGFITEYNAGMSGGIFLGKEKSEYLVNFRHPIFMQHEDLAQVKTALIKENFRGELFIAMRLSHLKDKEFHPKEGSSLWRRLTANLLPIEEIENKEKVNEFQRAINATGDTFNGELRAFQLQRYISKLSMSALCSLDSEKLDVESLCKKMKFEKIFSDKFLREVIVNEIGETEGGNKLSHRPLKKQPEYYKKLEMYMEVAINNRLNGQHTPIKGSCAEKISSIAWLVSLCAIYTARKYSKLLVKKGMKLGEETELAIFSGDDDISLYFFGLVCANDKP